VVYEIPLRNLVFQFSSIHFEIIAIFFILGRKRLSNDVLLSKILEHCGAPNVGIESNYEFTGKPHFLPYYGSAKSYC